MIAEQFLCIHCDNMVIPKFSLDADGVKKSSVKIPQCEACDGLSCYSCHRDYVKAGGKDCPNCKAPIEKRLNTSRQVSQTSSLQPFIEGELASPGGIFLDK